MYNLAMNFFANYPRAIIGSKYLNIRQSNKSYM